MEITVLDVRGEAAFELPALDGIREYFPYPELREYQGTALRMLIGALEAGYTRIVLEAPTGFGKSPIAVALARWMDSRNKRSAIIVSSKYLQGQYLRDFRTVTVRGRGNFSCIQNPRQTCDAALRGLGRCSHVPVSGNPKGKRIVGASARRGKLFLAKGVRLCPYWKQKCAALRHPYPLFNYDYFLYESQYVGDFGKRDLLIADEAHTVEGKLMSFVGFDIGQQEIEAVGGELPAGGGSMQTWKTLLEKWRELFQTRIEKLEGRMSTLTHEELEKLEQIRERVAKCDFLVGELEEEPELWVVSVQPASFKGRPSRKVVFKPIDVRKWGAMLFSRADACILQSATIINPETLCRSLAIDGEVLFIRVPSIFPEKRRPFLYRGVGRMSRSGVEQTLPRLIQEVKRIMEEHPNEKGVVHTHSYRIQQAVVGGIQSSRLLSHDQFSRDHVLETFKGAIRPLVLVTPSATEGVDFKGEQCRWQILCKVPYPYLGEPQVRKRAERDRNWYTWLTALKIVQTYGRGMRTVDDFCTTYMLDEDFRGFYERNVHFFPEWFRAAVSMR